MELTLLNIIFAVGLIALGLFIFVGIIFIAIMLTIKFQDYQEK
jgi:hypothetical protein